MRSMAAMVSAVTAPSPPGPSPTTVTLLIGAPSIRATCRSPCWCTNELKTVLDGSLARRLAPSRIEGDDAAGERVPAAVARVHGHVGGRHVSVEEHAPERLRAARGGGRRGRQHV